MTNKCRCGSKHFETIDVTPMASVQKKYFTRCAKCGLVLSTCGCSREDFPKTCRKSVFKLHL